MNQIHAKTRLLLNNSLCPTTGLCCVSAGFTPKRTGENRQHFETGTWRFGSLKDSGNVHRNIFEKGGVPPSNRCEASSGYLSLLLRFARRAASSYRASILVSHGIYFHTPARVPCQPTHGASGALYQRSSVNSAGMFSP